MSDRPYPNPVALRQGATALLRRLARETPGTQLQDLQRQFAYDRILARVFMIISTAGEWPAGYARVARDVPRLTERDLESAVVTASLFLDPVLAGNAAGHWDPTSLSWR